jgi:hypothetical protein
MKVKKIKHPPILLATFLKPNVEIWWFQSKVLFFKIWQLQPTKSLLALQFHQKENSLLEQPELGSYRNLTQYIGISFHSWSIECSKELHV